MVFLIPLTCFPDIRLLSIVHSGEAVSVEVNDRYERQSLRNRYSICGSQGKLDLSIPVTLDDSRMYATAQIAYREAWARTHWRSITACYNNAPYFVYYADAVESLFLSSEVSMQNFNLKALQFFCDVWRMKMPEQTKQWEASENRMDLRAWVEPKSILNEHCVNYNQVFDDKTGFIPGCSGLDLLFNYGPDAVEILDIQFSQFQFTV
jgi:hypothetical protein